MICCHGNILFISIDIDLHADMANIDKKLAKKLAKMPEEERQAFLENLRLQEEENQRKKEEMLLRFLKVRSTHALVRAIAIAMSCVQYYSRTSWKGKSKWRR